METKAIFCEGKDDELVLKALCDHLGLKGIRFEPVRGKDQFGKILADFTKLSEFVKGQIDTIVLIGDADIDPKASFQRLCSAVDKADARLATPKNAGEFTNGSTRVGIYIIGGPDGTGALEDTCLASVGAEPEFPCVGEYFDCITRRSGRTLASAKAKMRVWLASHEDFDPRPGAAAEKGCWNSNSPVFDELKTFLRRLENRDTQPGLSGLGPSENQIIRFSAAKKPGIHQCHWNPSPRIATHGC